MRVEKFNYEQNGYNRQEVNRFVTDVIKQTEGIIARCRHQAQQLEMLQTKLEQYEKMEQTLNQAMMNAEVASENIKRMAREESEMIVLDAKHSANRIVNEALLKAEKIEQEADTLERNMKIFKRKLKIIVEQQMAVVEEIETLELE